MLTPLSEVFGNPMCRSVTLQPWIWDCNWYLTDDDTLEVLPPRLKPDSRSLQRDHLLDSYHPEWDYDSSLLLVRNRLRGRVLPPPRNPSVWETSTGSSMVFPNQLSPLRRHACRSWWLCDKVESSGRVEGRPEQICPSNIVDPNRVTLHTRRFLRGSRPRTETYTLVRLGSWVWLHLTFGPQVKVIWVDR